MKKKSNACTAVFMIIILVLCAFIPAIVLRIVDKVTDGKVYYSAIKAIEFDSNLSSADMLYLMHNGISIDATEGEMNYKLADMDEVFQNAMAPYVEKGLISEEIINYTTREFYPYRQYSGTDSAYTGTYWAVSIDIREPVLNYLYMIIDDSTGNVLYLNYITEEQIYPVDEQSLMSLHEELVNTYSDSVGTELTTYAYENTMYDRNNRTYIANSTYGEVYLNIQMTSGGLFVGPALEYEAESYEEAN